MATLYHIYLAPKKGVTMQQIQEQMNLALDWFRYDDKCWVVQSSSDTAKWQTRLKPLVEPDGSLFICKLDPSQHQGWMSKQFWDWLKGKP